VALHEHHYKALPIYTHAGSGLQLIGNKPDWLSIRDHRLSAAESRAFVNQSPGNPVLTTQHLNSNTLRFSSKAAVDITAIYTRFYTTKCVIEGWLTPQSITTLGGMMRLRTFPAFPGMAHRTT
jgi:hypothetical protein